MRKTTIVAALLGLTAVAQADILTFRANLTGGQETPANASTAIGNGEIQINTNTLALTGFIRWKGLTGGAATGSHVHVGIPDVAGNIIYDYGVAGAIVDPSDPTYLLKTFSMTLVDKTAANSGGTGFNGVLRTPAQQIQNWFIPEFTYMNIHNAQFRAGEIRGQLQAVPEPTSMVALGSGTLAFARRRRTPVRS